MSQPTVLCVDDDITILMSLKAQIKHAFGNRVYCEVAESAAMAWEIIDDIEHRGDRLIVIISDWLMPETRGDTFLIAVHAKYPEVVKLMLTGHAETAAIARAREHAQLAECFNKPWSKAQLLHHIAVALGDG